MRRSNKTAQRSTQRSHGTRQIHEPRRGPWLRRDEDGYWRSNRNNTCWLCADGLDKWFDIPESATKIRVVLSRRRSTNSYEIIRASDWTIWLRTWFGDEWTFTCRKLHSFVRVGEWISIEYRS